MYIEHIYSLKKIVEVRSFTAAANELYMSQQNLSNIVSRIENTFHCKIFIRSRKGVQLTEDGKILMAKFDLLLAYYEDCLNTFANESDQLLTISLQPMVLHNNDYINNDYVNNLLKYGSRISIDEDYSSTSIINKVINKKSAFGLILAYHKIEKNILEQINIKELASTSLAAAVPSKHPLSKKDSCTFEECFQYPLVLDSEGVIQTSILDNYIRQKGLVTNYHVCMTVAIYRLLDAVRDNFGITFTTLSRQYQFNKNSITLVSIADSNPVYLLLIYAKNLYLNKSVQDCIDYTERYFLHDKMTPRKF